MIGRALLTIFLGAALVLACPVAAFAQEAEEGAQEQARVLFEQGMAAAASGDHTSAARALGESFALFSHPGTLVNLAASLELAGQLPAAHRRYAELLERFGAVISGAARENARQQLASIAALVAIVTVRTEPEGALVFLGDELLGTAPLSDEVVLLPGEYTLVARLEGYDQASHVVALAAGDRPSITIELDQLPAEEAPARLVVTSSTEGAHVSVDGSESRQAPATFEVPPGEREVVVEAPGFDAASRTVLVEAGEDRELAVALEARRGPSSPVQPGRRSFWRGPWPWIIGGVLIAAAGAVTAVVLLSPEDDPAADWELGVR